MPKIDIEGMEWASGSTYPAPFQAAVAARTRKRLGDAVGLSQYGVNLTRLDPGAKSALRHWHEEEDEFVYLLDGELTLIEDDGETILRPGDAAGFKAGTANAHHLVNLSDQPATYLEIGTRAPHERAHYPDDDLQLNRTGPDYNFARKDGSAY